MASLAAGRSHSTSLRSCQAPPNPQSCAALSEYPAGECSWTRLYCGAQKAMVPSLAKASCDSSLSSKSISCSVKRRGSR
eukprot:scaffold1929_cov376-Prasinococcus_capsulatus_cf.AAC.17